MRGTTRNFLIFGFACFLVLYFVFNLTARGGSLEKEVRITKGEGFSEVADRLAEEGLVRSSRILKFYGILSGNVGRIKPGDYVFSSDESAVRILNRLVAGPEDIKIVIVEGATMRDIDSMLAEAGISPAGAVRSFSINQVRSDYPFLAKISSLEGFLFPDTYRFHAASTPEAVIRKFLDNFYAKAYPEFAARRGNFYDELKIASLVEKEVPDLKDDGAIVAGIILRRLNIGMGLQIDATVLYARCGGALITCDNNTLSRSDFAVDSRYNTYLYRGLPPTPISNPGLAAIRAAINPQKSPYLYYLSDPKTKRTIFSETFDEHNENRAKYLGL